MTTVTHTLDDLALHASRRHRAQRWTTACATAWGLAASGAAILTTAGGLTTAATGPGTALVSGAPPRALSLGLALLAALASVVLLRLRHRLRVVDDTATSWSRGDVATATGLVLLVGLTIASVCDATPLAAIGYLPLIVAALVSPDTAPVASGMAQAILLQLAVVGLTVTSVVAAARSLDALRGRGPLPRWLRRPATVRWGRVAVVIAMAAPLAYAATRVAWALGWTIGIDAQAYAAAGGNLGPGVVLAAGAMVGAALTSGLTLPWGERLWSWVPVAGGRPVPVGLAMWPASVVAALLLPAGVSMVRAAVSGTGIGAVLGDITANWAAVGTTFLWPLWSVALAAATLAYVLRRREPMVRHGGGVGAPA